MREVEIKLKWLENQEGVVCSARGIDIRTKRILSDVSVNIPYETLIDFEQAFGVEGKNNIESSATSMAKSIAEKMP